MGLPSKLPGRSEGEIDQPIYLRGNEGPWTMGDYQFLLRMLLPKDGAWETSAPKSPSSCDPFSLVFQMVENQVEMSLKEEGEDQGRTWLERKKP
ncbi:hypothetical protein CRG98_038880 [Punica granatum]|uniref:Uncharacterized protein n=1 Tax=Punica granatum TaxID=22663 RepID=A0A2I0I9U2_PUNGR|nr:hypothetical protein CRG98_038880 [Punica granatum]